jgi:hypothetical protein
LSLSVGVRFLSHLYLLPSSTSLNFSLTSILFRRQKKKKSIRVSQTTVSIPEGLC